jgi:hypothetical protein
MDAKISPGVQPRPQELEKAFENISRAFIRYAQKEKAKGEKKP